MQLSKSQKRYHVYMKNDSTRRIPYRHYYLHRCIVKSRRKTCETTHWCRRENANIAFKNMMTSKRVNHTKQLDKWNRAENVKIVSTTIFPQLKICTESLAPGSARWNLYKITPPLVPYENQAFPRVKIKQTADTARCRLAEVHRASLRAKTKQIVDAARCWLAYIEWRRRCDGKRWPRCPGAL